jgi:uncharacterized protein YjiS (DUF1127 family)
MEDCMDTIARTGPLEQIARAAVFATLEAMRAVDRVLLLAVETLLNWQARARMRTQMAELSDHLRKDMGLTVGDVIRESDKPFWMN